MGSARTDEGSTTTGRHQSHRSNQAHRSALLRWAGGFLVAVGVVLAFLTLRATADDDLEPAATPPSASAPASSPAEPSTAGSASSATQRPSPVRREGREPTSVAAGGIDVDAPVVPIASVGRTLTPPSNVSQVGWWSDGAKAGATQGSVLLTGHTVHTGGGVFDDLGDLRKGERVTVGTGGQPVTYRITEVSYLTKAELSKASGRLFDPSGPAQLVLVTCESWDGAGYDGNTVVVATPV